MLAMALGWRRGVSALGLFYLRKRSFMTSYPTVHPTVLARWVVVSGQVLGK